MFGFLFRSMGLLCALCILLSWLGGCGGPKPCQRHSDCKVGQRCDETKTCAKGCGSDLDCKNDGDICEPSSRLCLPRPCPRGGKPTSLGCICTADSDCKTQHRCVVVKDKYKYCLPVCEAKTVAESPFDRCVCPAGWKMVEGKCQAPCPKGMGREADGTCGLTLATSHSDFWERNAKGELRRRCPKDWQRGTDGRCMRKRPEPLPKLPKVGPQKACSSGGQARWDEGYVARAGLPKGTKVIYVDANQKPGGDGSQKAPHHNITKALDAAADGDVILLAPGTYGWGHIINNSLHIVGLCPDKVRLEAQANDTGIGIDIKATNVVVEGLSLFAKNTGRVGVSLSDAATNSKLRDLYIHGTSAAGVSVAGKGMILSQLELQASATTGVFVVKGALSMRLERSLLANHKDAGVLVDIAEQREIAEVHLLQNKIEENGRTGVSIGGTFKSVKLEGNVIHKNGKDQHAGGVSISHDKGEVQLLRNLIEANESFGVLAQRVDRLSMAENTIRKNERLKAYSAAVWVKSAAQVTLSKNFLQSFGSAGIRIDHAERISLTANWVEEATQADPLGAGITIQPGFGDAAPQQLPFVQLQDNVVLRGGRVWIFVGGAAKKIELARNTIRGTGESALQVGGPRRNFSKSFTLLLTHNALETGGTAAVRVYGGADITFKGNLFEGIPKSKGSRAGIVVHGGSKVLLEANVFRNLLLATSLRSMKELRLQENVVMGPAAEEGQFATGFSVESVTNKLALERNVVTGTDRGGLLRLLPKGAGVTLAANVWAKQRHVGLSIRDNAARITIEGDLFSRNGGRHLGVANQSSEVAVTRCIFSRATAAPAATKEGWGKSAGDGVYVGAKGLVRWAFSKQKPPCEEDARGFVTSIDEGWFARPIRVPHSLDVCQTWRFDMTSRTDDARREESPCAKCYKQKMGCRWVFKRASTKQGLQDRDAWTPDDVECVAPSKFDTCANPPKVTYSYLSTQQGPRKAVGQCEDHPKDPCAANKSCGESRSQTDYCSRERDGVGASQDIATSSFCTPRLTRGPCHPDRPACPSGLLCLATARRTTPLSAIPASFTLKESIFWSNPGPDIAMDQAGRVNLKDNRFYLCPKENVGNCPARIVYRRRFDPNSPQVLSWPKAALPKGTLLLWQRPSPFSKVGFQSRLNGDYTRPNGEKPTPLHAPSFCEAFDFQ